MNMMQMMLLATSSLTPPSYSLPDASLDLNFAGGTYRTGGAASTFAAAFTGATPELTYSTTSNSTMVNSAGNIVWAPHNLVTYSEDFSQWSDHVGLTLDSSTTTDPLGGSTAYTYSGFSGANNNRLSQIFPLAVGVSSTLAIWLKGTAGETIELELDTSGATENEITFTGNWQLETISNSNPTVGRVRVIKRSGNTADVISFWGAHIYRSDLGGMASVPGASAGFETYVPTNGSAEYLPRVGHHVHNGTTWVNEGLLIESEARTNLVTYSEDFSDAAWTNPSSGLTLTGSQPSPSGDNTAYSAVPTNASNGHRVDMSVSVTDAVNHTLSVFAKNNGYSFVRLRMNSEGGDTGAMTANTWAIFDLALNTVSSEGVGSQGATIEDFGNGWYRCSLTGLPTGTGTVNHQIYALDQDYNIAFNNWTGNGTDGVYIYGAQAEAGDTPSSYIPTNGGQGFRDAQTLAADSSAFVWNTSAVSLQMQGRMTYVDNDQGVLSTGGGGEVDFYLWKNNGTNFIDATMRTDGTRTGQVVFRQRETTSGLETVSSSSTAYSPGTLVPYNLAGRYTSTAINGAVDGTKLTEDTTPTALADLSASNIEIADKYMGTIARFRQWNSDIGEAAGEGIIFASTT